MFRLKLALRAAVAVAIVGGILFGSSGRIDLPFFWAYLAVLAGFRRNMGPPPRGRGILRCIRASENFL